MSQEPLYTPIYSYSTELSSNHVGLNQTFPLLVIESMY